MSASTAQLADDLRGIVRPRVAACRRTRTSSSVQVFERESSEGCRLVVRGIATCGSVHTCPCCAAKIMARRAAEITQAVARHRAERVSMLTLTMAHHKGDDLYVMRRLQTDAYSRMKAGRRGGELKEAVGYVGDVRGAEQTHGENGWHPHLHALWFLETAPDAETLERYRVTFWRAWSDALDATLKFFWDTLQRIKAGDPTLKASRIKRVLGQATIRRCGGSIEQAAESFARGLERLRPAPSEDHGVALTTCSARPDYIAKMGLEVSSITKEAGNPSSWGVAQAAAAGDPDAVRLWKEHGRAMFGARQLTWSRGLRELSGLDEDTPDLELADDAAPLVSDDAERMLGEFEGPAWDGQAAPYAALLVAYETSGAAAVATLPGFSSLVTPWGPVGRDPPPAHLQYWEVWERESRYGPQPKKLPKVKKSEKVYLYCSAEERRELREELRHSLVMDHGIGASR